MKIATATSRSPDPLDALDEAMASLRDQLGGAPHWVLATHTVAHDGESLRQRCAQLELSRVHGMTTSGGLMTQRGHVSAPSGVLGLWGISDPQGAYGLGAASSRDRDSAEAAREALLAALKDAKREGQLPALVWISAAPGQEEAIIRGIEQVLGGAAPIMGGSAADDDLSGKWQLWTPQGCDADLILVSVLFPSQEVFVAFESGYQPTELSGVVTRAQGRVLYEIDGEPAAKVYDRWTQGAIAQALAQGSGEILAETAMRPLGRPVNQLQAITYYELSHPAAVDGEGLVLFTEISAGDQVTLMSGTTEGLVARAGRVATSILETHALEVGAVSGGLVIYCAGCMMAVSDALPQVAQGITHALAGAPFLGAFTFGEQGCFLSGENRHANMMIAVMVIAQEAL